MFMDYKVYLIIYSILTFAFMFVLMQHLNLRTTKTGKRERERTDKWFLLFLCLTVGPQILRVLLAYGSFLAIDMYAYKNDSALIIEKSFIPSPLELEEDPYYRTFPIFTLLISLTKIVIGLDFYTTFLILNILTLVLLSASFWALLYRLFDFKASLFFVTMLSIVTISNSYFYGMYNQFIPVLLGYTYLLLLLIPTFTLNGSRSLLTTFFLFAIIALVHIDILVYIIIALAYIIIISFIRYEDQIRFKRPILGKILVSFFIFVSYISCSSFSLRSLTFKFLNVFEFLSTFISAPSIPTSGYAHPIPVLNALGLGIQIGVVGAYVTYTFIYFKDFRKSVNTFNGFILGLSSVSIFLLSIGTGWYFYGGTWGKGNVMMYFTMYGFFLITISNAYIIITILRLLLSSSQNARNRALLILLSLIMILAAIGSILDPLTFNRHFQ